MWKGRFVFAYCIFSNFNFPIISTHVASNIYVSVSAGSAFIFISFNLLSCCYICFPFYLSVGAGAALISFQFHMSLSAGCALISFHVISICLSFCNCDAFSPQLLQTVFSIGHVFTLFPLGCSRCFRLRLEIKQNG